MAPLVACPHCNVHAILTEKVCPHCGNTLRRADGSIPKTAAAVVLGLTVAATGVASCSTDAPEYGVPATSSASSATTGGGMGGEGGAGGAEPTPEYGVAGASGEGGAGGSDPAPEYGVAGAGA